MVSTNTSHHHLEGGERADSPSGYKCTIQDHFILSKQVISDPKATKIGACIDFWNCEGEHKVSIVGSCWERITGQKLSI